MLYKYRPVNKGVELILRPGFVLFLFFCVFPIQKCLGNNVYAESTESKVYSLILVMKLISCSNSNQSNTLYILVQVTSIEKIQQISQTFFVCLLWNMFMTCHRFCLPLGQFYMSALLMCLIL